MSEIVDDLAEFPLLAELPAATRDLLAQRGRRAVHLTGSRLFQEGDPADRFWLIRRGRIAVDFRVPGRGHVVIEHLGPGTVLGWSWLLAPYRWHFGAVTAEQAHSIVFDATVVRRLCAQDPHLEHALARAFTGVLVERLQAARLRVIDLSPSPAQPGPAQVAQPGPAQATRSHTSQAAQRPPGWAEPGRPDQRSPQPGADRRHEESR